MANRKISQLSRVTETDIVDGFLMHWCDTNNLGVDAGNVAMERNDVEDYIQTIAATSYTTQAIANGINESIGLGAVASYEGFKIDAIIGCGTDRAIIEMKFAYDSTTAKNYQINIAGTLTSGTNIRQATVVAGQFYWKINNQSGAACTVKYKITTYDAI